MIKPEVMAPAGHWPQMNAAIEAGADAIYFGLQHFSARAKVGFDMNELPDAMRLMHQRGVRGYLTFNTLVFEHELHEATRALEQIAAAGVDAIIVQDVAVAKMAHEIAPDMEIHGSTQMSITSAEGVAFARQFGVSRVVLARELSIPEIADIRRQTDVALEMFVHGALCVSYSGQCFSSEAWGGRSANRGQCAQACRLPYELIVDDVHRPLADARYLLSPGDLYALPEMPEIIKLGISSLKIEGRYKDADYVALTTAAYRKAVDEAWAGLPLSISPAEKLQLEQVYSRGLGPWFVQGTNHQTVVNGRSPRHRGVLAGQVTKVFSNGIVVLPDAHIARHAPLKPGDGVVFDAADWRSPQEAEEGGRIYEIFSVNAQQIELRFAHGAVHGDRIRPGDLVWRSNNPDLDKLAKPYLQPAAPVHKQLVNVSIVLRENTPVRTSWSLAARPELSVQIDSELPVSRAERQPAGETQLRAQLGRLGNSPYALAELKLDVAGSPFVPNGLLNDVRRRAVEQLSVLQGNNPHWKIVPGAQVLQANLQPPAVPSRINTPRLHLLVRTTEQLDAAIAARPSSITLDYLDLYGLRPAVEKVQAAGVTARVASPRVLKPNEQRVVNFLLRLNCEIVVRSAGLLQALQQPDAELAVPKLIGDFSLNAANSIAARMFLDQGLARITPTHDLNAAQIAALVRDVGADRTEVVVFHHLPVFHTEHCVFCRFMSRGTSHLDCGHPCETHKLALRDAQGRAHPVMADVGCRNTVFGAQAQDASAHLPMLQHAGVLHYRLEFVHETAAQVADVSEAWSRAISGHSNHAMLAAALRRATPQGTTEGSLFVPDDYLKVPML